jgi:hypothetical protein
MAHSKEGIAWYQNQSILGEASNERIGFGEPAKLVFKNIPERRHEKIISIAIINGNLSKFIFRIVKGGIVVIRRPSVERVLGLPENIFVLQYLVKNKMYKFDLFDNKFGLVVDIF